MASQSPMKELFRAALELDKQTKMFYLNKQVALLS